MEKFFLVFYPLISCLICQHCFGYIERRTFRERSNIFCRLKKQCQQYEEWDDEYKKMFELKSIEGLQPDGFLVRIPFYVVAGRDAQIVFAETENPDFFTDNVYEIAFGGWENKRTTLRRKRQDEELIFTYTDEVLTENCPLKMLIEITNAGEIRIFVEHTLKPVIEFKDTTPLQIKYFGFSSLGQSIARFFYDCQEDKIYTKSQLESSCQHMNTTANEYFQFNQIQNVSIKDPNQYPIGLPLYIDASSDAHVLIASDNTNQNGYDIAFGENQNRQVSISKLTNQISQTLADYRRADIFARNQILTAFIRISRSGKIELFTKHDHTQYKLLASVDDPNFASIGNLNSISLSSVNNTPIDLYYDCKVKPASIDTQLAVKYMAIGHPLLLEDPPFATHVDKRNWLTSRCKSYSNTKYEYKNFFPLNEIRNSQPPGYIVRLAFYAQGTRNAHVLLSRTATPDLANENLYEFIIGGWVNSRVLIRRKKSDQVLQQVFVPPVLAAQTPTKFIIEVANSGFVRIYSESDKIEPIAVIYDPNVIPVKFVSFCAYDNLVKFFYDCSGKH